MDAAVHSPVPPAQAAPCRAEDRDLAAQAQRWLSFTLDGDLYAVGILAIKEIIECHRLTKVPMMPPSVRGVVNLRGAVVPVVDLSARFGRPPAVLKRRSCFIIAQVSLDGEQELVGMLIDGVNEVIEIAAAEIDPPPAFGAHIPIEFMHGVSRVKGRFLMLLDLDRVLAIDVDNAQGSLHPKESERRQAGTREAVA